MQTLEILTVYKEDDDETKIRFEVNEGKLTITRSDRDVFDFPRMILTEQETKSLRDFLNWML